MIIFEKFIPLKNNKKRYLMYKNSLHIPFDNAKVQKKKRVYKYHLDTAHFLDIDKPIQMQ